jgi:hypothetical protein
VRELLTAATPGIQSHVNCFTEAAFPFFGGYFAAAAAAAAAAAGVAWVRRSSRKSKRW